MSDRHLPDKAIDALDEAGSRVHINNINVPNNILALEKDLEDIKVEKLQVVKKQRFEEAARLRDKERQIETALLKAKTEWEEELKSHKETVTEDNVAEVVAMMTGVQSNESLNKRQTNLYRWRASFSQGLLDKMKQ